MFFGPWPLRFDDIMDEDRLAGLVHIMNMVPVQEMRLFRQAPEDEVSREENEFISKIMKIDPLERPTAEQLLKDAWFADLDSEKS